MFGLQSSYSGTPPTTGCAYSILYLTDEPLSNYICCWHCVFTARQDGNWWYKWVSYEKTILIKKGHQVITFEAPDKVTMGDPPFKVSAKANTGFPINLAITGNCRREAEKVTGASAGKCVLTATQEGNQNYERTVATKEIIVEKATQEITIEPISDKTAGDPQFYVNATASSGLEVDISVKGGCSNKGKQIDIKAQGQCTVNADQKGNDKYRPASKSYTFKIAGKPQTITMEQIGDKKVLDPDFGVNALASAGLPVIIKIAGGPCQYIEGKVHLLGEGECTVNAEQNGNHEYLPAPLKSTSFPITKHDPTLIIPQRWKYGDPPFEVKATSGPGVTFEVAGQCSKDRNNRVAVKGLIGIDNCIITASQPGDRTHNPIPSTKFIVNVIGLSFECCQYIYTPPADFCSFFSCIGNFWNGNGYVMQCRDGMFGKSGGIRGSCSSHGGNARALLQQ